MTPAAPTAVPGRHWALFVDWCTATDQRTLPATPETILAFLAELPAGPSTIRRRILAVDAAHRTAGYPPPSASPALDTLLRPTRRARFDPDVVAAALAVIPVGGWPAGIVGRRDAALVALICTAGLTRRQTQALRPSAAQGGEQPAGRAGGTGLPAIAATDHPGNCPACALSRWQRVAATTAAAGWRAVRNHLADLGEITAEVESFHDCTRPAGGLTGDEDGWAPCHRDCRPPDGRHVPFFCPIDRHGAPQTGHPLSARSVTTIIAARLAAVAIADDRRRAITFPHRPGAPVTWGSDDHARVVAARHSATERLAGFEADLDEADAYAEAILARLDADLASGPD